MNEFSNYLIIVFLVISAICLLVSINSKRKRFPMESKLAQMFVGWVFKKWIAPELEKAVKSTDTKFDDYGLSCIKYALFGGDAPKLD